MAGDMTVPSVPMTAPSIRPVSGNPDRTGLGARFSLMQGGSSDASALNAAPRAASGLGDPNAANDLARLAKRYENAALSAARKYRTADG